LPFPVLSVHARRSASRRASRLRLWPC